MFQHTARVPSHGTTLFVPGDRTDRVLKALSSGADAVVVDLEDAVEVSRKESARSDLPHGLADVTAAEVPAVYVRINGLDTQWARGDVTAVRAVAERLTGVVVPKSEQPGRLVELGESLPDGLGLLPIVESARGLFAAEHLAAVPRARTLMFGTLDLAAELGVTASVEGRELLHARSQLVLACAASGLAAPIDGPHPALDDVDGLARSSAAARELGFAGKVVLHPRQLDIVRAAFAPTEDELARAREVVRAHRRARRDGTGAVKLADGSFVDRPVVLRAAALLGIDREVGQE